MPKHINSDAHKLYVSQEVTNFTNAVESAIKNVATSAIPGASLASKLCSTLTDYKKKALQNKAEMFLAAAKVDENEVDDFINSLDEEQQLFLMEAIFDQIFSSNEKEKINLYAFLFKDCVLNATDFELYARCVQAIKSCFIVDIEQLGKYEQDYWDSSELGSRLLSLGLLRVTGENLGSIGEDGDPASTRYARTTVGEHLLKVLRDNHWDKLAK